VRRDVRFQTAIGLDASADGLSFERMFAGPVRSTGPFDPYFVSTPSVVRNAGGFRMWYVGGVAWRPVDGTPEPFYDIRTVHSADGLAWSARPATAVALNEPAEAGLGRPHALTYRDGTRLWYSSRSGRGDYRIVTAALDPDGIAIGAGAPLVFSNPPVAGDFDDAMQCYACVVPHGDDLVMVYNGNDFGRVGFGWARAAGAWHAGASRAAG
jgi:hypothetical protein